MKTSKVLKALSALAQENRLAIFRLLIQVGPSGISAGEIAEQLSIQPATLSFHLSQLTQADLIFAEKNGRMIHYSAKTKIIKKIARYLMDNSYKSQLKLDKSISKVTVEVLD